MQGKYQDAIIQMSTDTQEPQGGKKKGQQKQKVQKAHYWNNLGVIHLKLKKYALAVSYFSRAISCVQKQGDPHSKTSEILYNYGIALYNIGDYQKAFTCFERAAAMLRMKPRVWYYMGLCCVQIHYQQTR